MKTGQIYDIYRNSTGVTTDTRNIRKGQIFFALKGAAFDGNKFAAEAVRQGATAAVIDDPLYQSDKTILVDNCLEELQALATLHRKRLKIPVLAITGTNGKTTTKELIAVVLSEKYIVHYTKGNLNNHIGVPLTLLSAHAETELMIIEMGANHQGEIRMLCDIALPDYGIITNIGTAHIEGFGSYEGVIKTKTELYDHLKKVNGLVIYNDEDKLLTRKVTEFGNRAVTYSNPDGNSLSVEEETSGMNLVVRVGYKNETKRIVTALFGRYNLWNVKAAIATGLYFNVEPEKIARAISSYTPSNNRSQIKVTRNNTLICDSYNANPSSMSRALESFGALQAVKKMVILGDMLELGEKSDEEHRKIIHLLDAGGIDRKYLTGKIFSEVGRNSNVLTFPDVASLAEFIRNNPVEGYTILIKGSRGIGLEKIYDLL